MGSSQTWLVMKFGGTSVATAERWQQIYSQVKKESAKHRVCLVVSALSQVSNRLEAAIEEALSQQDLASFEQIKKQHQDLAQAMGLNPEAFTPVQELLDTLEQLLGGIRLTQEASPRLRARVMSFGELASTHLGRAVLQHKGLSVFRLDAREVLVSDESNPGPEEDKYLQARVSNYAQKEAFEAQAGEAQIVITQGFIARRPSGDTCLLGRGGSDTSATLFGALLEAARVDIWTDVHGMFTADPRSIPEARLIRQMGFREAQELAGMGAKVLHPRAVQPALEAGIPLAIRNTAAPEAEGTKIVAEMDQSPAVMAVVKRSGVILLTISTMEMWGVSGFLGKVFAPFAELGISIDLVATSQVAVSVTLDGLPGGPDGPVFAELLRRLELLGKVSVIQSCAVVSIVGRRIRTVLHELGPAFAVFREHSVHLVSESSEDLNFSFVVDEEDAGQLVASLHARLVPAQGSEGTLGPSWGQLTAKADHGASQRAQGAWWSERRAQLLELMQDGQPKYVYDLAVIRGQAKKLMTQLPSLERCYYAMKANGHDEIVRAVAAEGLGLECVSIHEVRKVRQLLGEAHPILFTPNFCPVEEYQEAFELGAEVTIDDPEILREYPQLFSGKEIAVRLDPGRGQGHHKKVMTAGAHAKFGHPIHDAAELQEAAAEVGAQIVGLHSHVGSGIFDTETWTRTAKALGALKDTFPQLRWIDVGGGLGVSERAGQAPLDLDKVESHLALWQREYGRGVKLRMEPGRYLVSEGGVLLSPVTQVRSKGGVRFIGLATGMNSLIRPSLYGAWHGIHNLSRVGEAVEGYAHIVGPICETGDILGRDRLMPKTQRGDIILVENGGAYGAVMGSSYNMRSPAQEIVLKD